MRHEDLEFVVSAPSGETIFRTFEEAAGCAVVQSIALGEKWCNVDVLCWSEGAARAWGGDVAVESYREDPDASVFYRIRVKAMFEGRVA